jgi:hypothetical protein
MFQESYVCIYVFSERNYVQPKYAVYMPIKEYGIPSIIVIIIIIIIINRQQSLYQKAPPPSPFSRSD